MSLKSTKSPFRNVSYDVLREIFFHCLPERPLDEVQPNSNIAPILLCHICSSWRVVALSSPSIWTHLHIRLPILWDDYDEPTVRDPEALAHDIEFMNWWRNNHGSMAPFLRFNLHRRSWREVEFPPIVYLELEAEDFFVDYMSSAQYLDVGLFYPYLTRQVIKRRSPATTFTKLHTLLSHSNRLTDNDDDQDEYIYDVSVLPSHIPPTLRRLSIENESIPDDYTGRLDNWSTLTHLSLHSAYMSFETWYCLIRSLESLQYGHFSVKITNPRDLQFPLTSLFQNLELPALHTLSLTFSESSWRRHRVPIEIHNVLKSAPAVKKLILGTWKENGCTYPDNNSAIPSAIGNDKLLSMDAPHLLHLQVELRCSRRLDMAVPARRFVKNSLVSNRWLDLASSTNPIRKITIVVKNASREVNPDFHDIMKDALMWNIQKYVTTAANVSFEVASEADAGLVAMWKTWDSKI